MAQPVVHFEIGSRDHAGLCAFYAKMFNWNISPSNPFIQPDPNQNAIGGHVNCLGHEPHNYVMVYIEVDDLDAYLKKAESLGGRTVIPPCEVPQTGHFAWMQDPEGNTIGLWKPMKP